MIQSDFIHANDKNKTVLDLMSVVKNTKCVQSTHIKRVKGRETILWWGGGWFLFTPV